MIHTHQIIVSLQAKLTPSKSTQWVEKNYTAITLNTDYQWRRYTRARHVRPGWKSHRPGSLPAYCFALLR